jgi:hypothetical protein
MTEAEALDKIDEAADRALAEAMGAVNGLRHLSVSVGYAQQGDHPHPDSIREVREDYNTAMNALKDAAGKLDVALGPLAALVGGGLAANRG